ncbi:hypothetical protein Ancab_019639 [Ancistrocladus abbreviatus]
MKKWHPDRWMKDPIVAGEAKRRFQQIQEAYPGQISTDSIFKNYEHGGSKRTTAGSNYDPPSEVSRPLPRDEFDRCIQRSRSIGEKRNNHEHSPSRPNRPCSDGETRIPSSQSKKEIGQCLLSCRSYGDVKSSHKHTLAISNRPYSDDDPRIPRTIGGEEDSEKRSLGLSITKHSNDVTSRPRLRLGQNARLLVHEFVENSCFTKASSVMDPGKSKALINDPIREEEALERNKRDVENLGLTTQQMGLSLVHPKDYKGVKTGNLSKKPIML